MDYHSIIKKELSTDTKVHLKGIMRSERRLDPKGDILYDSIFKIFWERQRSWKEFSACQGLRVARGVNYKEVRGNLGGGDDGNVLYPDCGDGYMTEHTCQNSLNCIFKRVDFAIHNYTSLTLIKKIDT